MSDWNTAFPRRLDPHWCPWFCTCESCLCWVLFPFCLSLIVAASTGTWTGTMSLVTSFSSMLELVTGCLFVCLWLVSGQINEMNNNQPRVESFSVSFFFCLSRSVPSFLYVSLSLLLLCALTRFSPKLCLGPEWSLCFSHLPYHTSCTTIGGHNVFTMPSGGREHTQIKADKDIHDRL